jgi:hypothetical protein
MLSATSLAEEGRETIVVVTGRVVQSTVRLLGVVQYQNGKPISIQSNGED